MTRKSLLIGSATTAALVAGAAIYGTSATAQAYGPGTMGPGYGYMHGPGMMDDYGPGYGPGWMHGNRGDGRNDWRGYGPRFGRGFMHRQFGPGAPRAEEPDTN